MHARALVIPVGGAGVFGSDPSAEFTERKSRRSMARRHQRLWVPLADQKFAHSLDIRQVCYQLGKVDSQFQTGKIADRKNCSRKERICWADDAASHSRPSFGAFYCPPPTLSRLPPPPRHPLRPPRRREKNTHAGEKKGKTSRNNILLGLCWGVCGVYMRACVLCCGLLLFEERRSGKQSVGAGGVGASAAVPGVRSTSSYAAEQRVVGGVLVNRQQQKRQAEEKEKVKEPIRRGIFILQQQSADVDVTSSAVTRVPGAGIITANQSLTIIDDAEHLKYDRKFIALVYSDSAHRKETKEDYRQTNQWIVRFGQHAGYVHGECRWRSTGHCGSDHQTRNFFWQQYASVAVQFGVGSNGFVRRRTRWNRR